MQIVIEIDEELYKRIKKNCYIYEEENESVALSIIGGTPLPKGHGRLIDADYLREDFKASKRISFAERMDISCIVEHAPTIIEADKESEEE